MALAAAAFGLAFAMQGAHSECLSPSAEAGATATTVYRCQEADSSAGQLPVIVNPKKSTVVERGSADIPWFEPRPTKTADPIETAKKPLEKPAELSKKPADVEPPKKPVEKVVKPVKADPAPAAAAEAKPVKLKTKKAKKVKKAVKAKRSKAKLAKAKRTKTKQAKVKRSKTPTASAKTEAAKEIPKAEPAKADEKVIVWTKKDMPLGSRVKNWLGF